LHDRREEMVNVLLMQIPTAKVELREAGSPVSSNDSGIIALQRMTTPPSNTRRKTGWAESTTMLDRQ